ncbi:hypothetical protein AB0F10_45095, partial [Actinoplanes sp. NPDC026623]
MPEESTGAGPVVLVRVRAGRGAPVVGVVVVAGDSALTEAAGRGAGAEGTQVPGGYRIGLWQRLTAAAYRVDFVGSQV